MLTIALEMIRSKDVPGEVCLDTWTTFNDATDPVQYQPFKPSKDSYIFLYNQVSLDESKFPLSCCGDNLQRVSDILDKFPREQLSVLDEHYDYQVGETDMSRPITRQELHDVRVALMNEVRDLKYTVIESQQRMEAVLARVEMCLNEFTR